MNDFQYFISLIENTYRDGTSDACKISDRCNNFRN